MTAALLTGEGVSDDLREAVASGTRTRGVEGGVGIRAPEGEPLAWAGRHRFVPARDTAELRAVITPFYVSLEARRQTPGGGSAVGSVLLDAAPAAPDRIGAVSARFEDAHGVALRFYAPGLAPHEGDVFDFCPARCAPGAALLSVQPVPPSQSDAKLAALRAATARAGAALALVLLLAFVTAPRGRWRWLVTVAAAWSVSRALQDSARWAGLFSPASFYRPLLGGFSASAGGRPAPRARLIRTALGPSGTPSCGSRRSGACWCRRRGVGRCSGSRRSRERRRRSSRGARPWRAGSCSRSGTPSAWVPRPTRAPRRCWTAWGGRCPRRRLGPPASCTRGGSLRRSRPIRIRRAWPCGIARASRRPRSGWRAWTCRRRWWPHWCARPRRRAGGGAGGWGGPRWPCRGPGGGGPGPCGGAGARGGGRSPRCGAGAPGGGGGAGGGFFSSPRCGSRGGGAPRAGGAPPARTVTSS